MEEPFFPEASDQNLLRQINKITTTLFAKHKTQAGLGLYITDLAYGSDGVMTSETFSYLSNKPLIHDLQAATRLFRILGNDAQCLTLGNPLKGFSA